MKKDTKELAQALISKTRSLRSIFHVVGLLQFFGLAIASFAAGASAGNVVVGVFMFVLVGIPLGGLQLWLFVALGGVLESWGHLFARTSYKLDQYLDRELGSDAGASEVVESA